MTLGRKIWKLGEGSGCGVWESRHRLALGRDGAENEAVADETMHGRLHEQGAENVRGSSVVCCLLLPLLFQVDKRNSTDVKKRKRGRREGKGTDRGTTQRTIHCL